VLARQQLESAGPGRAGLGRARARPGRPRSLATAARLPERERGRDLATDRISAGSACFFWRPPLVRPT